MGLIGMITSGLKKSWYVLAGMVLLSGITACQESASEKKENKSSPNIIFILTDDLGYGDLGITFQNKRKEQGQPFHQTPNLDQLANESILLTRHYVGAPVCAPSRASLLQGVHQGHANVRNNQFDKALSDNHNLASVLKAAGYRTGIVGKWGLQGRAGDSPESWEAYPTKRGFDHFFGYVRHVDGHNHYPAHKAADRPEMELYSGSEEISEQLRGVYTADLFTAASKKWISDSQDQQPDQPFFLYLAYDTPHAGLQVAPSPYPEGGGLEGGVQWIGEKDHFINAADSTIDDYIHPDYRDQDWPMPYKRFASMVRRIDNGVADIQQLLKDLDIAQNTLIVFSSDNGPHRESYGYGNFNPTFFDSFGPLDGIKRDTWEGGLRVPTIAHWPGHIPEGRVDNTPSGFHDWLPTFADLAGVPAPARTDGASLVPLLTGEKEAHDGVVYSEYQVGGQTPNYEEFDSSHRGQRRGQMQVVYLDGYKGIRHNIQSAEDDFRIYDTIEDPGEENNLAGSSPEFEDLQQRMKAKVLRMRRPDSTAKRPYDDVAVPAVDTPENMEPGISYDLYNVAAPWTPDVTSIKQKPLRSGTSKTFDLSIRNQNHDFIIAFDGFIKIPETGSYSFSLSADRGAVMHIHQATLIDADKGYEPGTEISGTIQLEKGHHPVKITYAHGSQRAPALKLSWQGPGIEKEEIGVEYLYHKE
ncbi:sulfatase-like hydrolase/transferase [Fodinibius salsisoli]|uniref:Sulfatase-like hydrolase/transferase n=1 Tax=Fodinibius salsisoli TaxID=2820877 RepID=A0ABT3PKW7_9BACT|nr:sulfatase-like hydrolase/transferase [Fodinibius salsisoli]MCW9706596.1 sulfatase-like hydrolase/transferase [Fodinibius salsisoli]